MTKFIGISGKKQTGKDSSAKFIRQILRYKNFSSDTTSFAEPLKEICVDVLGLAHKDVYGTNEQKDSLSHIKWDGFPEEIRIKYANNYIMCRDGVADPIPRNGYMTNREVLQVMGTDIFRSIYNDVWARAPFRKIWEYDVVIFSDVRFPNEKLAIEENGGIVLRLERDTGLEDTHASETALDNTIFEHKYVNNGSLEDLNNFLKTWTTTYL